jgi:hypothetical protein
MLTPLVSALVIGNCVAGLCLAGSVAFVCGVDNMKKLSAAGLDGSRGATNSFFRLGRGHWRTF